LAGLSDAELEFLLETEPIESFTESTITDRAELGRRLDHAREHGWVIVEGELESGLRSIAAPIKDRDGKVVAAINISASTSQRARAETLEQHLPLLLRTATAINEELKLQ